MPFGKIDFSDWIWVLLSKEWNVMSKPLSKRIFKTVGAQSCALRRLKQMTQADFAGETGIMINTISRVEGVEVDAKLSTLKSIADRLGCPVSELLDLDELQKGNMIASDERTIRPDQRCFAKGLL